MTPLQNRLTELYGKLPDEVTLVAVSKFHPAELIREAYDCGQRDFGESRAQELLEKKGQLPGDIRWHFIGHLQKNKVKSIVPFVHLIHSVDSLPLLAEIDKQANKAGRVIPVLLELHVAEETTKSGFAPNELMQMFESGTWKSMHNVKISGLMCMATNTDDIERICSDFDEALSVYDDVKKRFFNDNPDFFIKSWGMSHDWTEAISHGSSMVRIGTYIFGQREY